MRSAQSAKSGKKPKKNPPMLPEPKPRMSRYARLTDAEFGDGSDGQATGSTDAALVDAALQGDQQAFAEIVSRYTRKGFWIAFHILGRIEDARDVVQDAFVRVFRSLAKFDHERNFYTWFYRIVMNLAIDALRKGKNARMTNVEDFAEAFAAPEPGEAPLEQGETRSLVWQVLGRMDAKFKSVLVLRDIHGMSCREIAPILKVTHATVRWRLHRGRQIFREDWERHSRGWQ